MPLRGVASEGQRAVQHHKKSRTVKKLCGFSCARSAQDLNQLDAYSLSTVQQANGGGA
jgi:hypothetical protein